MPIRPVPLLTAAALALALAAPAAAQVITPRPLQPSEDLLARPNTYPGADLRTPVAATRPGFQPAVPGCIGSGLPRSGYGDIANCYTPGGVNETRPGIVSIPLD